MVFQASAGTEAHLDRSTRRAERARYVEVGHRSAVAPRANGRGAAAAGTHISRACRQEHRQVDRGDLRGLGGLPRSEHIGVAAGPAEQEARGHMACRRRVRRGCRCGASREEDSDHGSKERKPQPQMSGRKSASANAVQHGRIIRREGSISGRVAYWTRDRPIMHSVPRNTVAASARLAESSDVDGLSSRTSVRATSWGYRSSCSQPDSRSF